MPPELREQSGKEFLQFRRERGKECSSCCALIRSRKRAFYDDPDLEISIKNDPEKKDIFQTDLEEFELKKQEDARTKSQRQPTKRVEASHSTGFKMRMVMGYFWPVDVLKREKKEIPKTLTTISYNGRSLRGTILDSSHGVPIGVIEMESYDDKNASKVTLL